MPFMPWVFSVNQGKTHGTKNVPWLPAPILETMEIELTPEQKVVKLLAALDEAEADLEAGHYSDYTDETLPNLAQELKREARALRDGGQIRSLGR
jgi:hypothetical protein